MNISKSILFQNSRKGTKKIAVFKTFFCKIFKKTYMPTQNVARIQYLSTFHAFASIHKAYISLHRFNLVTI